MSNESIIALIYARVSTKKQDPKSQLIRCEEYCKQKGYVIEKCFEDKFSGGGNFLERPAMRELLDYASKNMHKQYIVIFDDLKRFARDTKFHIELRSTFASNGLIPECLNYNFDDSPEGRFMETLFAAQNELERLQNRRQVIQKQRARLIAGYNAFVSPRGYKKIKKDPLHGTIDVPDEKGVILAKALKKFAYGELSTRMDVARYLKKQGILGKQDPIKYLETVKRFLSNVFYAGYIEYTPWDVTRRKGHHKPLISLKEFNLIQSRLYKTDHAKPIRKDINPDFPLRGLVNCYYCKDKLTGCKSRGRWGGLYYKYYCKNKNCALRTMQGIKSVSSDDLHREFKSLLETFNQGDDLHVLTHYAFTNMIKKEINHINSLRKTSEENKQIIQSEIDILIARVTDSNTSIILRTQYEKKIEELVEKLAKIDVDMPKKDNMATLCRTPCIKMFEFLKNPYKIWASSDIYLKRKLFYFIFEKNIEYQPSVGFRTPKTSLIIRLFEPLSNSNTLDVKIAGETSNPLQDYIFNWNTQIRPIL